MSNPWGGLSIRSSFKRDERFSRLQSELCNVAEDQGVSLEDTVKWGSSSVEYSGRPRLAQQRGLDTLPSRHYVNTEVMDMLLHDVKEIQELGNMTLAKAAELGISESVMQATRRNSQFLAAKKLKDIKTKGARTVAVADAEESPKAPATTAHEGGKTRRVRLLDDQQRELDSDEEEEVFKKDRQAWRGFLQPLKAKKAAQAAAEEEAARQQRREERAAAVRRAVKKANVVVRIWKSVRNMDRRESTTNLRPSLSRMGFTSSRRMSMAGSRRVSMAGIGGISSRPTSRGSTILGRMSMSGLGASMRELLRSDSKQSQVSAVSRVSMGAEAIAAIMAASRQTTPEERGPISRAMTMSSRAPSMQQRQATPEERKTTEPKQKPAKADYSKVLPRYMQNLKRDEAKALKPAVHKPVARRTAWGPRGRQQQQQQQQQQTPTPPPDLSPRDGLPPGQTQAWALSGHMRPWDHPEHVLEGEREGRSQRHSVTNSYQGRARGMQQEMVVQVIEPAESDEYGMAPVSVTSLGGGGYPRSSSPTGSHSQWDNVHMWQQGAGPLAPIAGSTSSGTGSHRHLGVVGGRPQDSHYYYQQQQQQQRGAMQVPGASPRASWAQGGVVMHFDGGFDNPAMQVRNMRGSGLFQQQRAGASMQGWISAGQVPMQGNATVSASRTTQGQGLQGLPRAVIPGPGEVMAKADGSDGERSGLHHTSTDLDVVSRGSGELLSTHQLLPRGLAAHMAANGDGVPETPVLWSSAPAAQVVNSAGQGAAGQSLQWLQQQQRLQAQAQRQAQLHAVRAQQQAQLQQLQAQQQVQVDELLQRQREQMERMAAQAAQQAQLQAQLRELQASQQRQLKEFRAQQEAQLQQMMQAHQEQEAALQAEMQRAADAWMSGSVGAQAGPGGIPGPAWEELQGEQRAETPSLSAWPGSTDVTGNDGQHTPQLRPGPAAAGPIWRQAVHRPAPSFLRMGTAARSRHAQLHARGGQLEEDDQEGEEEEEEEEANEPPSAVTIIGAKATEPLPGDTGEYVPVQLPTRPPPSAASSHYHHSRPHVSAHSARHHGSRQHSSAQDDEDSSTPESPHSPSSPTRLAMVQLGGSEVPAYSMNAPANFGGVDQEVEDEESVLQLLQRSQHQRHHQRSKHEHHSHSHHHSHHHHHHHHHAHLSRHASSLHAAARGMDWDEAPGLGSPNDSWAPGAAVTVLASGSNTTSGRGSPALVPPRSYSAHEPIHEDPSEGVDRHHPHRDDDHGSHHHHERHSEGSSSQHGAKSAGHPEHAERTSGEKGEGAKVGEASSSNDTGGASQAIPLTPLVYTIDSPFTQARKTTPSGPSGPAGPTSTASQQGAAATAIGGSSSEPAKANSTTAKVTSPQRSGPVHAARRATRSLNSSAVPAADAGPGSNTLAAISSQLQKLRPSVPPVGATPKRWNNVVAPATLVGEMLDFMGGVNQHLANLELYDPTRYSLMASGSSWSAGSGSWAASGGRSQPLQGGDSGHAAGGGGASGEAELATVSLSAPASPFTLRASYPPQNSHAGPPGVGQLLPTGVPSSWSKQHPGRPQAGGAGTPPKPTALRGPLPSPAAPAAKLVQSGPLDLGGVSTHSVNTVLNEVMLGASTSGDGLPSIGGCGMGSRGRPAGGILKSPQGQGQGQSQHQGLAGEGGGPLNLPRLQA